MRAWELFEPRGIECYDDAAAVAAGRRQVEGPECVQWGGGTRGGGAVPAADPASDTAVGNFR